MSVEERLQELRKAKGLSQEQLAETLGVSRQAVSKWESGQSLPEVEKLISLSTLFGTTLDYILKGTPQAAEQPMQSAETEPSGVNNAKLGSQIMLAVAALMLTVGTLVTIAQASKGFSGDWGGLVIAAVGVMFTMLSWFITGGRISSKPLFALNIFLICVCGICFCFFILNLKLY